jgi:pimeloyl-ACP methyl ester carboxylesterase
MPRETVSSSRHDDGTTQSVGLHVEHHGPKADPPIILVHGAPDRSAAFRHVLGHLDGCDVTVYDRRGYGRSLRATPARAMVDHAHDLLAVADTCTRPPVVVAHSFGANPTMLAASLRPDGFTALGLWEPPLPWVAWWSEQTKNYNANIASSDAPADDVEAMYRRLLGDEAWNRLPVDVRDHRRAEGPAFQTDMASELDAPFDFQDVVLPAFVGYGSETSTEHAYGARWLAETLPNARTQALRGTGHFAPRTHPEDYAAFVLSVLDLVEQRQLGSGHR